MDSGEKTGRRPGDTVRVYPSEIGSWEYCRIKWYFETLKKSGVPGDEEGKQK